MCVCLLRLRTQKRALALALSLSLACSLSVAGSYVDCLFFQKPQSASLLSALRQSCSLGHCGSDSCREKSVSPGIVSAAGGLRCFPLAWAVPTGWSSLLSLEKELLRFPVGWHMWAQPQVLFNSLLPPHHRKLTELENSTEKTTFSIKSTQILVGKRNPNKKIISLLISELYHPHSSSLYLGNGWCLTFLTY